MLHNDVPSRVELESLASVVGQTCLSVYTPNDATPDSPDAHRLAFENQTRKALELVADTAERDALAEALQDLCDDDDFWRYQSRSLVVLASGDHVHVHRVANHLQASETVGDRYFLKPLLRAVTFPQTAFIIALSEGAVRLIKIAAEGPAETVEVANMPNSAADHAGKASLSDRARKQRLHGAEDRKVRVRQYCRAVDQAIRSVLSGRDVPLILAATEPIDSIFRSVNSYPRLLAEGIEGNPEERSDADLAAVARGVLDGFYAEQLTQARHTYEVRQGQGRAQSDLADIARSATYGLVDTLFVDIDSFVAGTLDPQSGAIEYLDAASGTEYDVVDEVTRRSLLQGGRILAVRSQEVPGGGKAAAILRYAP
ncbi:hypothetical protein NGTWS1803_00780 [Mycolicibacterium cyprinidarum]|nr:hypothetical protein NGTWS1803_00780 [Mycolicibacterium sp. NGTWS1803]